MGVLFNIQLIFDNYKISNQQLLFIEQNNLVLKFSTAILCQFLLILLGIRQRVFLFDWALFTLFLIFVFLIDRWNHCNGEDNIIIYWK